MLLDLLIISLFKVGGEKKKVFLDVLKPKEWNEYVSMFETRVYKLSYD